MNKDRINDTFANSDIYEAIQAAAARRWERRQEAKKSQPETESNNNPIPFDKKGSTRFEVARRTAGAAPTRDGFAYDAFDPKFIRPRRGI